MAQLVLFSYRASSEPFDLYVGLTSTFTVFKHPRFFLKPSSASDTKRGVSLGMKCTFTVQGCRAQA